MVNGYDDGIQVNRKYILECICDELIALVFGKNFDYIGGLFDKGLGRKMMKRDPDQPDSETRMDYLMGEQIIHGDVDEVIRRLNGLREETGDFGMLILMGYDWDDKAAWLRSMELFVNEVMPAMN